MSSLFAENVEMNSLERRVRDDLGWRDFKKDPGPWNVNFMYHVAENRAFLPQAVECAV